MHFLPGKPLEQNSHKSLGLQTMYQSSFNNHFMTIGLDLEMTEGELSEFQNAYDEKRNKSPDTEVEKLIIEFSEKHQIKRRDISKEEILERCLYPMINEGFKILEEGMAIRASNFS